MRRRTYLRNHARYSQSGRLCNELLRVAMQKMVRPLVSGEKT
jgi:hypothetical protein